MIHMKIGVLAVQGAFAEHEKMLEGLGAEAFEIRQKKDLCLPLDGIVLPGGESTVMGRLLKDLDLLDELKLRIQNGLPVLATCAGLILLAEKIEGEENTCLATIPMTVKRNAYGRQLGSFITEGEIAGIGTFPMRFIRAPYIKSAADEVKILGRVGDRIVAAEYGSQIALAFHPELTQDARIHAYFLKKAGM